MFHKSHHSRPIEITCPYCGFRQEEPARVVSSFCRACSEHFRVRKGIAIPNPGIRASGITEIDSDSPPSPRVVPPLEKEANASPVADPKKESAWLISSEDGAEIVRPLSPGKQPEEGENAISVGAFFGFADAPGDEAGDGSRNGDSPSTESAIGGNAEGKESLARGSMAALIEGHAPVAGQVKGRMPADDREPGQCRQSGDHRHGLEVRCFRCHHIQEVSRFAKSTQCGRCSVYINLADHEITSPRELTLRTRGDITIGRRGSLTKCEIACHNLTAHGTIDAFVDCSGRAVFRRSGVVRGHLHCRKTVIGESASIEFPDGLHTGQADIQGKVKGDITCSGTVRIAPGAEIEGSIRAVRVDLKEGARVHGETTIDPATTTVLGVGNGFNSSVIS